MIYAKSGDTLDVDLDDQFGVRMMINIPQQQKLPFKSVAGALLFSVFLGPVGLLYATLLGGVVMIVLGFIVLSSKLFVPIALVWVISCIWSVAAVNKYNQKLLKVVMANKPSFERESLTH